MHTSIETVINPKKQTIASEHANTADDRWEGYNELIGSSIFTFVRLYDNGDGVFIDDEGLYAEERHFWIHRNYPQPLVNIGVFVGVDSEGETVPPQTSFKTLQNDIKFIGDDHDLRVMMLLAKSKIKEENGYEDYRPLYF